MKNDSVGPDMRRRLEYLNDVNTFAPRKFVLIFRFLFNILFFLY